MERYLGLDVHAQSCTLAVISAARKKLKDVVIETRGQALIEAIRTIPPGRGLPAEDALHRPGKRDVDLRSAHRWPPYPPRRCRAPLPSGAIWSAVVLFFTYFFVVGSAPRLRRESRR